MDDMRATTLHDIHDLSRAWPAIRRSFFLRARTAQ